MAKLTKTALKSLVKECLVEILAEGIGSTATLQEGVKKSSVNAEARRRAEEKRLEHHRKKFEVKVDDTVSTLTDDPIMQSIFAETAKTTLQEQMQHDPRPGATTAQPTPEMMSGKPSGIDLGNIFDGASSNWSELAFAEKKAR